MLSRVAERLYWMARYIERAESTARLLNAYTAQVMDLPRGIGPGWKELVDITGADRLFAEHYDVHDERNTVKFLLADTVNPSSIMSSLSAARENVRTTRDLLPTEAWENANELYLYAKDHAAQGIGRRNRFYFLKSVIFRCQQIDGLLSGTMSHGSAHDFVQIGRSLERADMTTRIVDSAIFVLMPRRDDHGEYDNLLWVNVLKSLSGYQMYRQHVRSRVTGEEVVRFLLKDPAFPRSVTHAVRAAEESLARLPRSTGPVQSVQRLRRWVNDAETQSMSLDQLHTLIDDVQTSLNEVHAQIADTWFALVHPTAVQAQTV